MPAERKLLPTVIRLTIVLAPLSLPPCSGPTAIMLRRVIRPKP
jgi:hypothetical protein